MLQEFEVNVKILIPDVTLLNAERIEKEVGVKIVKLVPPKSCAYVAGSGVIALQGDLGHACTATHMLLTQLLFSEPVYFVFY